MTYKLKRIKNKEGHYEIELDGVKVGTVHGTPNHPSAPAKYSHWTVRAPNRVDRRFTDINQVRAQLPDIFEADQLLLGEQPLPEKHPIPLYNHPLPRPKPVLNGHDPLQSALRELRELQTEAMQLEQVLLKMREYSASLTNRITKLVHTLEDEL
jgi:hypothetical protein